MVINLTLEKEAEKPHGSLFDGLKLKAEEGTVPLKTFHNIRTLVQAVKFSFCACPDAHNQLCLAHPSFGLYKRSFPESTSPSKNVKCHIRIANKTKLASGHHQRQLCSSTVVLVELSQLAG